MERQTQDLQQIKTQEQIAAEGARAKLRAERACSVDWDQAPSWAFTYEARHRGVDTTTKALWISKDHSQTEDAVCYFPLEPFEHVILYRPLAPDVRYAERLARKPATDKPDDETYLGGHPLSERSVDPQSFGGMPAVMVARGQAPRVTEDQVEAAIFGASFTLLPDGRTTICQLTLDNGFTVEGSAACVNVENYDQLVGMQLSRKRAVEKVWMLLGFRLADRRLRP